MGLEMAMMIHKYHFYTLLCLCAVLCIFFLNYFDSFYLKLIMINLLTSSFMDVIWEIIRARVYQFIYLGFLVGEKYWGGLSHAFQFAKNDHSLCGGCGSGQDDDGGFVV